MGNMDPSPRRNDTSSARSMIITIASCAVVLYGVVNASRAAGWLATLVGMVGIVSSQITPRLRTERSRLSTGGAGVAIAGAASVLAVMSAGVTGPLAVAGLAAAAICTASGLVVVSRALWKRPERRPRRDRNGESSLHR